MRKQKLDVNALSVESFSTTAIGIERGTVFGRESVSEESGYAGCPTQGLCVNPTRIDCIYPTPSCPPGQTLLEQGCFYLVPHTDPRACCTDATCGTGGSV